MIAGTDHHLRITDGWIYIVRPYRLRQQILDGNWKFSVPQPVKQEGHEPRTPEPWFNKTWRPSEIELVK